MEIAKHLLSKQLAI